jgi:hypothetical protein
VAFFGSLIFLRFKRNVVDDVEEDHEYYFERLHQAAGFFKEQEWLKGPTACISRYSMVKKVVATRSHVTTNYNPSVGFATLNTRHAERRYPHVSEYS